jgi:hypothetical protein
VREPPTQPPGRRLVGLIRGAPLTWFFVVAFAFTWALLPFAAVSIPVSLIALFGPAVAAVAVSATLGPGAGAVNTFGFVNTGADPTLRAWGNAFAYGVVIAVAAWSPRRLPERLPEPTGSD